MNQYFHVHYRGINGMTPEDFQNREHLLRIAEELKKSGKV